MCAFIMFFSLSQSSATKVGTEVAVIQGKPAPVWMGKELVFSQNDVSKRGAKLTAESIKVVKNLVESGDYKFSKVQILICSGILAEGFASNLVGTLVDAGLTQSQISVRFFGTPCGQLNRNLLSSEDEMVGKLALIS